MRLAIRSAPLILACAGLVATEIWGSAAAGGALICDELRPIRDTLAPLIRAAQERFAIPGISLALVTADQVLWREGFGYADLAQRRRAGPDTVYRAGSLAKPITALAVMQLAERGLLDIDQPLSGYLTEFSIRSRFDTVAAPITVRSVLDHHAGLPTDLNKGMWTHRSFATVARELREEYAAFPPDLVFSYSNVGYSLLGHMVQKVAGESFADYVQRHILSPLGMKHSGMSHLPPMEPGLAKGYRDGRQSQSPPIRDLPAFGLHTSVADMGRLLRAILAGGMLDGRRVIGRATLEQMFEAQNRDVPLDLDILVGLGWFLAQDSIPGAGAVIRHGGTTLSYGGEVVILPEKGLAVVVLANAEGSHAIAAKLGESILRRVLSTETATDPTDLSIAELEREVAEYQPAEMAGNYATDFGLISIRPKDAKVCACMVEETFDLIPYPNGWFGIGQDARGSLPSAVEPLAHMQFRTQQVDDREVVVGKMGDRRIVLGEKIPPEPVSAAWLGRIGSYQVTNPDVGFPLEEPELKLRNGHLCMSYRLPRLSSDTIQVPLRPISDTEAVILGLGRTRGETLRVVREEGEERLRYSGFVGRKVSGGVE
jgi:CubicO group peptidase (beta-lactamase class C family)